MDESEPNAHMPYRNISWRKCKDMRTRTVTFVGKNRVEIREHDVPALQPNQYLVETRHSLISTGTELAMLMQDFPEGSNWSRLATFPRSAGYANTGVVRDVGNGVDRAWLGRRVLTRAPHTQYAVVTPSNEYPLPIPEGVATVDASLAIMARIGMNGIRRGSLTWGEHVVVYGMGLIGQMVARFCAIAGARRVFAVDLSALRLGKLPVHPAIVPVNAAGEDVVEVVREHTEGRLADVAFELTGVASLIPDELKALRKQGRFVITSSPRGKTLFDFHDLCNGPSYTIIGSHNGSAPAVETPANPWTQRRHLELYYDYVTQGQLSTEGLVSHCVSYTEAAAMYQMLIEDRSQAMGVVLQWDAE